jgi:hypothetical protein
VNNCDQCYVKHGDKCPAECAKSRPEPLFKDVCKLYGHVLYKEKRSALEDDFFVAYRYGNYVKATKNYYQIKEKLK